MDTPISPEQAREYQEVAALVCLDLDLLAEVAEDRTMTVDELRAQIRRTVSKKDEVIADPAVRRSRYDAASALFGLAASGAIRVTPLSSD